MVDWADNGEAGLAKALEGDHALIVLDINLPLLKGLPGFLGNSTGLYLTETIASLDLIGARRAANILRDVEKILHKHGVISSQLRTDIADCEVHQITSFRELHGNLGSFTEEIERDAQRLYLCGEEGEHISSLLEVFVETHRQELLTELAIFDEVLASYEPCLKGFERKAKKNPNCRRNPK